MVNVHDVLPLCPIIHDFDLDGSMLVIKKSQINKKLQTIICRMMHVWYSMFIGLWPDDTFSSVENQVCHQEYIKLVFSEAKLLKQSKSFTFSNFLWARIKFLIMMSLKISKLSVWQSAGSIFLERFFKCIQIDPFHQKLRFQMLIHKNDFMKRRQFDFQIVGLAKLMTLKWIRFLSMKWQSWNQID